ncbi:MAG TPA: hypothetical protein VK858_06900 [Longimicrobiales bacterium]|nr:hypothetical protein [Longimicrobiales bacterium]
MIRRATGARRLARLVLALVPTLAAVPAALTAQVRDTTAARPDTSAAQDGIYDRPFIASLGRTAVGGYVEANTNYFKEDGIGDGFSMEMRRFNIFLFSAIGSRIRFVSELEFEHGTEEIALETALLDVRVSPALILRGGVLLPPIGYLNQNHDSPRWNFVERPLVTTEIIPTTLSEIGFGVLGKLFPGGLTLSYDLYVTNGLQDGVVGNAEGRTHLASGRSEELMAEDNNGSPAVSGRLALARPGRAEVGLSFYTALYNAFQVEGDVVDDERRVTLLAVDGQATLGPAQIRAEVALADIDVPPSLEPIFATRQWGGHLDVTLPVWKPRIGGQETPGELALDLRLEHVDLNDGTFPSTGRDVRDEITAIVPGVSFRPVPDVVVRMNYRREWIDDFLGNPTAIRAGWQVGLAAYF